MLNDLSPEKMPTNHLDQTRPLASQWRLAAKRLLDVAISAMSLVILSPFLPLIAIIIKTTSPGPVFYQWVVIGKDGKRFTGYKFRTMVVNADELKKELWQYNERRGPIFKMENDPRITPLGRILGQFSLDELPQLWSVLKGDMSLVGPRPVAPHEWEHFEDWQRQKLSVKKPGMICLWHVRDQSKEFNEWIRLDLKYTQNWPL